MDEERQSKPVRPRASAGQRQTVSSAECDAITTPMKEQLVIAKSSPILGESAEVLKQYMAKYESTRAKRSGGFQSLGLATEDTRCDVRPKSTSASHNKGRQYPYHSGSVSSILQQSETMINSPANVNTPLMVSGSRTNVRNDLTPRCPSSPSIVTTSTNTEPKKDNALKLNFKYTRRYILPARSSSSFDSEQMCEFAITNTHSSSASLASSTTSIENTTKTIYTMTRRTRKHRHPANFTKYIPVPIPLPTHVPKLLLNEMDMEEWNEAQAAYEKDKLKNMKQSGGETCHPFNCTPVSSVNSGMELKNLAPSSSSLSSLSEADSSPLDDYYHNYSNSHNIPKRMDGRYDLDKAELLIKSNIKKKPNYTCILYVGLPEYPNFPLCHAMTDLCVSAMLNFFHPYRDVQCLWIPDIRARLVELLRDHTIKPKFNRLLYLRKFDAILVLSEDASHLLRHKDTCFMHSLASALRIQPHKLLAMCKEDTNNINKDEPYRPETAF